MSLDLPDFEPDIGDPKPLTSAPERGIRVQAERSFIEMVQAAFLGNDEFPYHPDENQGRLYVRSAVSKENQAFLPRVEVKVGPISEYDGSIDNLNKWTEPVQRHLYVDQAQVAFVCTAEEEPEANDLGERVRRVLDMARKDLGKRGLFAMQRSELTTPKPARPGTEEDDVYQSTVKVPFMIVQRQEREEDPTDPVGSTTSGVHEISEGPDDEDTDRYNETEETSSTASSASVESVVAKSSAMGTDVVVTFSKPIGTHQVSGITANIGPEEINPYAVRDSSMKAKVCIETQISVPAGTPVSVSYDPGNLRDEDGHIVSAFGPIEASWA